MDPSWGYSNLPSFTVLGRMDFHHQPWMGSRSKCNLFQKVASKIIRLVNYNTCVYIYICIHREFSLYLWLYIDMFIDIFPFFVHTDCFLFWEVSEISRMTPFHGMSVELLNCFVFLCVFFYTYIIYIIL